MRVLFNKVLNLVGDVRNYIIAQKITQKSAKAIEAAEAEKQAATEAAKTAIAEKQAAIEAAIAEEKDKAATKLAEMETELIRERQARFEDKARMLFQSKIANPKEHYEHKGNIYILCNVDNYARCYVKIGLATDLQARKSQYNTGTPVVAEWQYMRTYKVWNPLLIEQILKELLRPWADPEKLAKGRTNGLSQIEVIQLPAVSVIRLFEQIVPLYDAMTQHMETFASDKQLVEDGLSVFHEMAALPQGMLPSGFLALLPPVTPAPRLKPHLDLRDSAAREQQEALEQLNILAKRFVSEHYASADPQPAVKLLPIPAFRKWLQKQDTHEVTMPAKVSELNRFISQNLVDVATIVPKQPRDW